MKTNHLLFLLLFTGLSFALFFNLSWFYILFLLIFYFLSLRRIRKNQLLEEKELLQFREINAYMSQISQSFVRTKNILSALHETVETFSTGPLKTILLEAIDILLLEGGDISLAQRKALGCIEAAYPCEKLHNLHEFMLLAEKRGGECKREFILLEKMRLAWERAVLKYHKTLLETRNTTTLLYGLMLGICIFILHAFPTELSIIHLPFIQVTNCILTMFFILFFLLLDNRVCGQLFHTAKVANTPKEISIAFPKWLFELLLLLQQESVESAILHTLPTAPSILQPELKKMSDLLLAHPGEISIFTSFLSEYNLPQVEMNMRKLYALSIGLEAKDESVSFLIESNLDSLMLAEEKNYEQKGGVFSLLQALPLFIISFAMLLYCVAIIMISLSHIMHLFE